MIYLQIVGGFVLLVGGAEIMVRGAVGMAQRLGVSTMVIGMTVVAFGTSAPELVVSLNAAFSGAPGLSIGNLVGSNIANILLILGISGMITPIACATKGLIRDALVLLGGTLVFSVLTFRGVIDLWAGIALLAAFGLFLWHSFRRELSGKDDIGELHVEEVEELGGLPQSMVLAMVMFAGGLGGLLFGSELLVRGAVATAQAFGVSDAVIGLSIIAIGTSLPELAASAVAAYRGHSDVALGNVVGSNLFNVLGVVGVVSVLTPLEVPERVISFDVWMMVIATLILMPFMVTSKQAIGRIAASAMVALYVVYMVALGLGIDRILPA